MMIFCTHFDSYFLARGIAMIESLKKHGGNFHIYIFAFDEITEKVLSGLNFPEVTLLTEKHLETPELLKIKSERTRSEYFWTCTPAVTHYVLTHYPVEHCVYLDADIYFYQPPDVIFQEWGSKSILITRHNYASAYRHSEETSGIYCVQFTGFKKDTDGIEALTWWKNACLSWCFDRFEDGKFGDQKYLDDWPVRFKNVCVTENFGAGAAPWNVRKFNITPKNNEIILKDKKTGRQFTTVFFHYHGVKFFDNEEYRIGDVDYKISKSAKELFYKNYIAELVRINQMVRKDYGIIDSLGSRKGKPPVVSRLFIVKQWLKRIRNQIRYLFINRKGSV